jgi:hypothetical protein
VRSTSVPTAERLAAPLMRSPSPISGPMAGDQTSGHVFGAFGYADIVGHEPFSAIRAARARPPVLPPLTQMSEQLLAQLAVGKGVERLINGLVAHSSKGVWAGAVSVIHGAQSARDLQGRPAFTQLVGHMRKKRAAGDELAGPFAALPASSERSVKGWRRAITLPVRPQPLELPTDR